MKDTIFISVLLLLCSISVIAQSNERLVCPEISLMSPIQQVVPGETITYTAHITGLDSKEHALVWDVDKGKIIQGQGTNTIFVSTDGLSREVLNASVKLTNIKGGCRNRADGYVVIAEMPPNIAFDYFNKLPDNDVRARVDAFIVDLVNDEDSIGYIFTEGSPEQMKYRKNLIEEHLRFRKFDESRITFIDQEKDSLRTKLLRGSCPNDGIIGLKSSVRIGEPMIFSIGKDYLFFPTVSEIRYRWIVNKGKIFSGQETNTIIVDTDGLSDEVVEVTVEIDGLDERCKSKFTETGIVAGLIEGQPIDEFGKLKDNDVRARIDNLLATLKNVSVLSTGFIVSYGSPKDVLKREELIRNHIKFRGFAESRILFQYKDVENKIRTKLWIAPEGSDASNIN